MFKDITKLVIAPNLNAQGKYEEAEPLFRQSVEFFLRYETHTGNKLPNHESALANYLGVLLQLGLQEEKIKAKLKRLLNL